MKTIQITEITDDYEKKRIQYNNQAIQKYGEEIKQEPYNLFYLKEDKYQKLFSLLVELTDHTTKEIQFGSTDGKLFKKIFPEDIPTQVREEIIKKINTFWALHKQEIMNGIDIQKIIENDSDNLLNYYPKKTTKTNILSKVLKRGK